MDAINSGDDLEGVRASFMRGGTSKGLFFHWQDLPDDRDAFLCAAMGSPDPNGRQLDGMGGGISSLSKAMLVRRSGRVGVDVDYLFAQVEVGAARIDYGGNCGNLSAAVGAFAVDQGLVQLPDGPGVVRMFNENTAKRIDCHLTVRGGRAAVLGDHEIAGVAGQGAAIRLDFRDPGGARTGRLLPTGEVSQMLTGPGDGFGGEPGTDVPVSIVDAANPCVFVPAAALGLDAAAMPADLDAPETQDLLEHLRAAASVAAGLAETPAAAVAGRSVPKIAIVGPPVPSRTLSGTGIDAEACDLQVRMISMGKAHLAIPLTGAMCVAVAARLPGSVVAGCARARGAGEALRIGTASGVVPAMAEMAGAEAASASVYRTARVLMKGIVYGPV